MIGSYRIWELEATAKLWQTYQSAQIAGQSEQAIQYLSDRSGLGNCDFHGLESYGLGLLSGIASVDACWRLEEKAVYYTQGWP